MSTADWCDSGRAEVLDLSWKRFGRRRAVDGAVETVRVTDSNQVIRAVLAEPGADRVLVVDGGGAAARVALVGDRLAELAVAQGWQGLIIDGLVRDVDRLGELDLGVWARGTSPRRGPTTGPGERGIDLHLGGPVVTPGARVVADGDGVVLVTG